MLGNAIAIAALAAACCVLSACGEPETVTANGTADPQADNLAKAAPVTLPPAIRESKTYRCADNSLIYVNFLTDGLTANLRDNPGEPPIAVLKAPRPGAPFVAEGFSLSGSGDTVTFTSPAGGTQTCKS